MANGILVVEGKLSIDRNVCFYRLLAGTHGLSHLIPDETRELKLTGTFTMALWFTALPA